MEKINIAVICPDVGIDFGRSKIIYTLLENYNLFESKYNLFLITNKESNINAFENINVNIKFIPIVIEKRNPINFIISLVKLFTIAKHYKISLLHSHHRYSDLMAFLVSRFLKIPTCSTVHSFTYGNIRTSYLNDEIICVSHCIKEHLIKYYNINNKKLHVVYNGTFIPKKSFRSISKMNRIQSEFKILCIGRFDYDKGQDVLIKAMEIIWKTKNNIVLTLVGEYSRNTIKYMRKNNKIVKSSFQKSFQYLLKENYSRIRIVKSDNTPWNELIKTDLVVIPSRIEAFGLVAIEAGGLGKCVIAADTGGLMEIIKNEQNGLLFESENYYELSEKISFLINNKEQINYYGRNLKKDVFEKYSIDEMVTGYLRIYSDIFN
ncbi:MAG: glycosyltransferase family 4 protein [Melioribacteraceae bacterium]|nr:glycosyltransferase family 4 protein [Melioribacteraceae bacterium]MCF8355520.1 glycosyltransferase family 4 protein [Melioribacteraceae bacterium]MCF8394208.1 glycosyltransferase family 4 protein [Melioribacteraceae bacterium]MCF8419928.1 glycosyltransferase family 4 protein [Melioribacteraceae bacterium]